MWQERFENLLGRAIGLDPATVGAGVIRKAFESRMAAHGLKFVGDYLELTRGSEPELQALIEEVVVPESWFFRDGQPFSLLQRLAREGWLNNGEYPRLRVLSLPCAGGEEPYSIAMALLEAGMPADRFAIDAVDVSYRSLERAKRGVYGSHAFRGQELPFRCRYFRCLGASYEIDPFVKATVRFHCGNLLDPNLLRSEPPYDFIFFRNLLIYLDASARKQAMATLERLLGPSGILFSGHAECLSGFWPGLVTLPDLGTFAYRRAATKENVASRNEVLEPRSRPSSTIRPRELRFAPAPAPVAPPSAITSRPHVEIPPASVVRRPSPSPHLEQASELANQRRYEEAIALCERFQRESGPTADSYYLLGMIHQAASQSMLAEAAFHKAVYLDGLHDEALLALALLAQRRGDSHAAAGLRRRAERALQRKGTA